MDILKCQILGEVEYAQHNFARLRPILYSRDGRAWTGVADRSWFPQAGLVFSLATELRFAQGGSMWTFQVRPNERQSGAEDGKDAFMTIQVKPASRFLTELEPRSSEELRRLATLEGFEPKASQGGVLLPESEDRWVLATDFERGSDERARVTNVRALGHMRVLEGTLEELAGCPTPDGRWFLPVIHSGHGSNIRNWRPPSVLAEQLANDLKRWMPHAPHKARAALAANALRDLAPALDTISAARSIEVRAALDRLTALSDEAELLTSSIDELVKVLLASPAIADAIEVEKSKLRQDLETQALESAERFEAEARSRLAVEQAEMRTALERDRGMLEAMRKEIADGESAIEDLRRRQRGETAAFTRSLEALIARAKKEPAAYAAEWLAKIGMNDAAGGHGQGPAERAWTGEIIEVESIGEAELGRALQSTNPFRNEGVPLFLVMDAAIRARELVLAIGPRAREIVQTWLSFFAPNWVVARTGDPTLLAFDDLLPSGPRGANAPLAAAIAKARAMTDRVVVALLDDVDPPAGGFWLPQAARAARRPAAHSLPPNMLMVALIEGEADGLGFSLTRVGELFPITFDDAVEISPGNSTSTPREIPANLFAKPLATGGVRDRVAAIRTAAYDTFAIDDADRIADEFALYLRWSKLGAKAPSDATVISGMLAKAAAKTRKGGDSNDA